MGIIKKVGKSLKIAGLSVLLGIGSILVATGIGCAIGAAVVDNQSKAEFYSSQNLEQQKEQTTTGNVSDAEASSSNETNMDDNLYYLSDDPTVVKDRQTVYALALASGFTILTGCGVGISKGVVSLTGMESTHETIIDEIKYTIDEIKQPLPKKKRKTTFETEKSYYNPMER